MVLWSRIHLSMQVLGDAGSFPGREVKIPHIHCSVVKSCLTLCKPMKWRTPGFPVLHYLLEFAQTHVHRVSDAIQPSRPLLPPSPLALNLSQHQGLFQRVSSSYQVAKVLEVHALEKEMATHSSVLAWRIPGTGSLAGCHLWGRTESDTIEAT